MHTVVPVVDEKTKNVYYLIPDVVNLKSKDLVVFDTDYGLEIGRVLKEAYSEKETNLNLPLKHIIRLATENDIKKMSDNVLLAGKALIDAKNISKSMKLDMNFVDCYFTFDNSQLVFSFLSDTRIDFRDLAKKLAQKYKTRIELRQIGVRDKAKKIGGLGPCGLFLCCNLFLTDFNSVSINMAKNQFLALNPSKINGMCGRLLCCLGYENSVYTELKKGMPSVGVIAETNMGMGKVVSVDVLSGKYKVDLGENGIIEFSKDMK